MWSWGWSGRVAVTVIGREIPLCRGIERTVGHKKAEVGVADQRGRLSRIVERLMKGEQHVALARTKE